ncbi:hypothetical protein DCC81_08040 [Chitinophaga parva]|uniref:Uncharacterized protein n=1 Tax=Chitinophaga parva TaxID=2169414 RepID=A0A2T7BNY1_9BACT|nr:hypothetical protein [Chitinophaga parva]PUZ29387.1 hypothetical protein DCC81_08040 [Chitinophaga parva]
MISFQKSGKYILPYNRQYFNDFLQDSENAASGWFGISFQLPGGYDGKEIGLDDFLKFYEGLFKEIVISLDDGSNWIVNHEYEDSEWFPNNGSSLSRLRELFKANGVPNSFRGALIFSTNDLLSYTKELISYPYAVTGKPNRFYCDLNISHVKVPLIIKVSAHLNIDFVTTEAEILKKIADEYSKNPFIVREYRGTSLF